MGGTADLKGRIVLRHERRPSPSGKGDSAIKQHLLAEAAMVSQQTLQARAKELAAANAPSA
ncbi:MAG: hypothetical protein ACYC2H_04820 [Thermoplasmatota archaeon]